MGFRLLGLNNPCSRPKKGCDSNHRLECANILNKHSKTTLLFSSNHLKFVFGGFLFNQKEYTMSQMLLLNNIRNFFKKNPAYEPELVELTAAIYVLSCRAMYEKPKQSFVAMAQRGGKKHCAGDEQDAGQ